MVGQLKLGGLGLNSGGEGKKVGIQIVIFRNRGLA